MVLFTGAAAAVPGDADENAGPGEVGPPGGLPDVVPDFVGDLLGGLGDAIGDATRGVGDFVTGIVPGGESG